MRGHSILVVERQIASFIQALQIALDQVGADSLADRDPSVALQRYRRFQFSAAAVNAEYAAFAEQLDIPVVLYDTETTPRRPDAIIAALMQVLSEKPSLCCQRAIPL